MYPQAAAPAYPAEHKAASPPLQCLADCGWLYAVLCRSHACMQAALAALQAQLAELAAASSAQAAALNSHTAAVDGLRSGRAPASPAPPPRQQSQPRQVPRPLVPVKEEAAAGAAAPSASGVDGGKGLQASTPPAAQQLEHEGHEELEPAASSSSSAPGLRGQWQRLRGAARAWMHRPQPQPSSSQQQQTGTPAAQAVDSPAGQRWQHSDGAEDGDSDGYLVQPAGGGGGVLLVHGGQAHAGWTGRLGSKVAVAEVAAVASSAALLGALAGAAAVLLLQRP